ncbi:ABC transporter permease [Jatrophihabitans cynanchi]|jgi:peptide/nickel transport system permease protein|uniref:ABC transporter permease n=1 Tax=Jatrophihabitans cynanchi TaxID=2944128 RepID=A0ABY7K532_9ACTN|nr:ABC transporter permease [Jatrophihabitans sp. SB3-54]WAX58993.1 ABC transporter permease [Jatrophihabitans sp. SB3-54]
MTAVASTLVDGRQRSRALARLKRNRLLTIGALLLLVVAGVALLAPLIAPSSPIKQSFAPLQAPSASHWFGTDEVGRDVLSRVVFGSRVSVLFAVLLVVCAMVIGGLVGVVAGFFGGVVDEVLMRIVDLVFAFPIIILAMAVAASLGPSLHNAVIAGVLVSWPMYARTVRGLVMSLREADFVAANRLAGVGSMRSMFIDVLPSVAGPILVLATMEVGGAILLLAGLSFLGLGAQPPEAEWGSMISAGINYFNSWWIAVFPGLAIMLVALAFNLIGDGLRDWLDPQTKQIVDRSS